MSDNFLFAQLQPYSLAGAGAVIGDVTITLKSMKDIDGNSLTMAGAFGTIGFGTLDPGNGTLEEQICFTGLTNNVNGTTTLTGVKSVTFTAPYTQTSGLLKTHAGSTPFVISNTSGFYDKLTAKNDDETIAGTWTFTNPNYPQIDVATPLPTLPAQFATLAYVNSVAIAGAPDATVLTKGIVQLATSAQVNATTDIGSTGASLVITPSVMLVSNYGVRLPGANEKLALAATTSPSATNLYVTQSDSQKAATYTATSSGSANNYTIILAPTPAAYTDGMIVQMKAGFTNTASVRVNVNSLGNQRLVKLDGSTELLSGDIVTGQEVSMKHDGTKFQMLSPTANSQTYLTLVSSATISATNNSGTITSLNATTSVPSTAHYGVIVISLSTIDNNSTTSTFSYTITALKEGNTSASQAIKDSGGTVNNGTLTLSISGSVLTATMTGPSVSTASHSYTISGVAYWY